jgi:hypothetical protein
MIVKFLNTLADQIRAGSARLTDAGWNVAQALVDGVVNGLRSIAGRAVSAAVNMAKSMLSGALGALGIHSPSTEFHWMGEMMVLGVANGLDDHAHIAAQAAENLGTDMIDTMGKTLDGLSKVLGKDLVDFNPTITPVLDLTQIKKDAAGIGDLLNMPEFDVKSALNNAKNAAAGFETNRTDDGTTTTDTGSGSTTVFNQTNNSPKALTAAEIYRQTNNLISRTKGGN